MKVLITGSAGHLGEALMRTVPREGHGAIGLDVKESPFIDRVGHYDVIFEDGPYPV